MKGSVCGPREAVSPKKGLLFPLAPIWLGGIPPLVSVVPRFLIVQYKGGGLPGYRPQPVTPQNALKYLRFKNIRPA